jgi:hypothetical protein
MCALVRFVSRKQDMRVVGVWVIAAVIELCLGCAKGREISQSEVYLLPYLDAGSAADASASDRSPSEMGGGGGAGPVSASSSSGGTSTGASNAAGGAPASGATGSAGAAGASTRATGGTGGVASAALITAPDAGAARAPDAGR